MVYFSSLLPLRFPQLFEELTNLLRSNGKTHCLIENTNDIWCRDYMPIKTSSSHFASFIYDPDYLKPKKYSNLKTDTSATLVIPNRFDFKTMKSQIVLDGGNVVINTTTALLTDKIFSENPSYEANELINELRILLGVEKIVILPKEPYDYLGHTDGMCRFMDDGKLLVTNYEHHLASYRKKMNNALNNSGLEIVMMPPMETKSWLVGKQGNAIGCYINFLREDDLIIVPIFGIVEDKMMVAKIMQSYPHCKVVPIVAKELAEEGGVLNCISWTN